MIATGEFKIGDRLPSENELAKYFSVSRQTLRSAFKLLEQEGKILVKHGVGTFIVKPLPSIPSGLDRLQSIGAMIEFAGLKEGERQESISTGKCDKECAKIFNIDINEPIYILERFRLANDEPVSFSLNILPKIMVGDVFDRVKFTGSLFRYLQRESNINIVHADTELEVPLNSDKYCKKLLVNPKATVLLLKQLHYDENNRPVLYSRDYLRNDIFKFLIRRKKF